MLEKNKIDIEKTFGKLDLEGDFFGFTDANENVPLIDEHYSFDPMITKIILLSLKYNKRTLIHGPHGTGKSTHIEQVAARLNWGCVRINLDGHLSRIDLIGRDAIVIKEGMQVTEFKEGLLPFVMQRPMILILDEYDAGRPEIMFVIQRLLEENGKLTLTEQNKVITPHPDFRIFATSNTIGTGDMTGLYHGTHHINQGQMDRWSLTAHLGYLTPEKEAEIILSKAPHLKNKEGKQTIKNMVNLAGLIRHAFASDEISNLISLRALINWSQNIELFKDIETAFKLSYFNRCDETDREKIAEFYQRCFGVEV